MHCPMKLNTTFAHYILYFALLSNGALLLRFVFDSFFILCEPCAPHTPCPPCQTPFMTDVWFYSAILNSVLLIAFVISNTTATKTRKD